MHVDDDVLTERPAAWPDAAALLDALARRAESAGAVLCFRIREGFARGDRSGFLRALQVRGHEIGWHSHGRRLPQAVAALSATGVVNAASVGAPGLVQIEGIAGAPRWRWPSPRARVHRALATAYDLGLRVLTDRRVHRVFGWQGRVAWRLALPGGRFLTSLDVTADPFSWGVLQRRGGQVHHARGTLDWRALDGLIARREAEPPLEITQFFGATFHEHNVCPLGSLTPTSAALDAFSRFLELRGPQLCRSAELVDGALDPGEFNKRGPSPRGSPTARALPLLWSLALRLGHGGDPIEVVVGDTAGAPEAQMTAGAPEARKTVRSLWFHVERPRGVVLAVHGGVGGCTQRLRFLGLGERALARLGWTLVVFDRTPGVPRTPGNPIHVHDTRAVLSTARAHALALGVPLRVLTWSGGLIPAVATGLAGVQRLVDVEGPVDRYSLVPPNTPAHELTTAEIFDDAPWAGREALAGLEAFAAAGGAYVRVQGTPDHVHGTVDLHARAGVAAAERGRAGAGVLLRLDRPLWACGEGILGAVVG